MKAKRMPANQSPDISNACVATIEHAPLPMARTVGSDHIVCGVNTAFCRLMGKPLDQLLGKTFARLVQGNKDCRILLDQVYRTGKSANHTAQKLAGPYPLFWSYTAWPVRTGRRSAGIIVQVLESTKFHEQTVAMNEALMLGSLRQHELAEASEKLSARLQAEIHQRKRAEAQRRLKVLTAANRKLKHEIQRRRSVEKSLNRSQQHQSRLLKQSRHMEEQLRQLSRKILSAQEAERKEISRELHDVIAQTLTGINVRLAALKREASNRFEGLGPNIASTQKLVEDSVNVVHRFARELRPAVLDDLGLIPALHSFMKNFTERTGVRTHLTAYARVEELNTVRRTTLFRVAQEALTNVARHAQASRVEVSIQKLPGGICMRVIDDGKSFVVENVFHGRSGKHLGLLGMRERLEMVGGSFAAQSAPGQGTTIEAQIPFGKIRRRRPGSLLNSHVP
ncbi:MAG: ATP-binding protein [Verrucomicrobiota bacterium]